MPPSASSSSAAQGKDPTLDDVTNENGRQLAPLRLSSGKTSTPLPRPPSRTAAASTPRNGASSNSGKPKELKQSKLAFPLASTSAAAAPASEPRPRSVASRTSAAAAAAAVPSRAPSSEPRPSRPKQPQPQLQSQEPSQAKRKATQRDMPQPGIAASVACIPSAKVLTPAPVAAAAPAPAPAAPKSRPSVAEMKAAMCVTDIRDASGALVEPPSEYVPRVRKADATTDFGRRRREGEEEGAGPSRSKARRAAAPISPAAPPQRPATVAASTSRTAAIERSAQPRRPATVKPSSTPEPETPWMHESPSNFSPPAWQAKMESMTPWREAAGIIITDAERKASEARRRERENDKAQAALREGILRSKGTKVRPPVVNGRLVRSPQPQVAAAVDARSKGKHRAITPPPLKAAQATSNAQGSTSHRRTDGVDAMQTVAPAISPSKRKALLAAHANGGVGTPARPRSPAQAAAKGKGRRLSSSSSSSSSHGLQREPSSSPLVHNFSIVYGAKFSDSESSSDEDEIPLLRSRKAVAAAAAAPPLPAYTADGRRILAYETQLEPPLAKPAPKRTFAPARPQYVPPPPAPIPPPYERDPNVESSQTAPGGTFTFPPSQIADDDARMQDVDSSQTAPGGTFTPQPESAAAALAMAMGGTGAGSTRATPQSSHTAPGGTLTQRDSPLAQPASPTRSSRGIVGGVNLLAIPSPPASPSPSPSAFVGFLTARSRSPSRAPSSNGEKSVSPKQQQQQQVQRNWYGETYMSDNASGSSVHEFDETYREPEPEHAPSRVKPTPLRSLPRRAARPSGFASAEKEQPTPSRSAALGSRAPATALASGSGATATATARKRPTLAQLLADADEATQPLAWDANEPASPPPLKDDVPSDSSSLSSPPPLETQRQQDAEMQRSTPPPVAYRSGPRTQQQKRVERLSRSSEEQLAERERAGAKSGTKSTARQSGQEGNLAPMEVDASTNAAAAGSSSKASAVPTSKRPATTSAPTSASKAGAPPRKKAKSRASLWANLDDAWKNLDVADVDPSASFAAAAAASASTSAQAGASSSKAPALQQASLGAFGFAQQPAVVRRNKRKAPPGEDEEDPLNRGMQFEMPEADEWEVEARGRGREASVERAKEKDEGRAKEKEKARENKREVDIASEAMFDEEGAAHLAAATARGEEDDETQPLPSSEAAERFEADETQAFEQSQRFEWDDEEDLIPPAALEAMQEEQKRRERVAAEAQGGSSDDEDVVHQAAFAAMLREQARQQARMQARQNSQTAFNNTQSSSRTEGSEALYPHTDSLPPDLVDWFNDFRRTS